MMAYSSNTTPSTRRSTGQRYSVDKPIINGDVQELVYPRKGNLAFNVGNAE